MHLAHMSLLIPHGLGDERPLQDAHRSATPHVNQGLGRGATCALAFLIAARVKRDFLAEVMVIAFEIKVVVIAYEMVCILPSTVGQSVFNVTI